MFFVIITAGYATFVPETLRQMEGLDFFTLSDDFLIQKISQAPGITSWLSSFLLQFFKWPWVGAALMALVLTASAALLGALPATLRRRGLPEFALLIPSFFLQFAQFDFDVYLQILFFSAALVGGISVRCPFKKSLYLLLLSVAGFFLLCWPLLVLAILLIAGTEYWKTRNRLMFAAGGVAIALSVVTVFFANAKIGFIPFDKRFLYSPVQDVNRWAFLAVFIAVFALLLLVTRKKKKDWKGWIPLSLLAVVTIVAMNHKFHESSIIHTEKLYLYANLADQKDWNGLLAAIPREEAIEAKPPLCYTLLAESALGTLADNVFSYPINDPEQFLFRHELKPFSCIFNRQFYDNLGIYDEAFRQAFEYGVMAPDGLCFSSLRQMAHYAILLGNRKVAEKYLDILDRSTLNGAWVERERQLMGSMKTADRKQPFVRDSFIGVYPMNSEMIRQLQLKPADRKVLDYLLIGLLMQRQLDKFSIILRGFPLAYKNRALPRAYSEAAAMLSNNPRFTLSNSFSYPADLNKQFQQFYRLQQQSKDPQSLASYMSSYWYYYFFAQTDEAGAEMMNKPVN